MLFDGNVERLWQNIVIRRVVHAGASFCADQMVQVGSYIRELTLNLSCILEFRLGELVFVVLPKVFDGLLASSLNLFVSRTSPATKSLDEARATGRSGTARRAAMRKGPPLIGR